MKAGKLVLLFMAVCFSGVTHAAFYDETASDSDKVIIVKDDPILAQMDSMEVANFFKRSSFTTDVTRLNIYNYDKDSVPLFSEAVYRERLSKLDKMSPFALDYHPDVKRYIEMYAVKRRGTASRMLGMAELYFPLFEECLARHKMPLELKYLAIVESALNPTAKSRAGAQGLWQFMYGTGKMYGLQTNSYIDERCDPVKSTEAACTYLKYLYKYYGNDWQLALAAYNSGPGNVNKAIRRSGGKRTYWELREYLPKETAGYVPAFIAVNYIMAYHKEHNIYPVKPKYFSYEIDSVYIKQHVTFQQISDVVKIPVEDLRFLNPVYLRDEIPASDFGYALFLPKTMIGDFIANESSIYKYLVQENQLDTTQQKLTDAKEGFKLIDHKVVKGEYLTSVAKKYNVQGEQIREWNKMNSETLYIGQVLKIQVPQSFTQTVPVKTTTTTTTTTGGTKYYTIRSGDTLWALSQKYHTTIDNLKKWNNLYNKSIQIGMKIIVSKG